MSRILSDPNPDQRRVLRTLITAQVLSGAGLAAGVSVGALLAADMLGSDRLAGLPSALFTIGSAGAAITVGRISHRYGRRPGLGAGYLAGATGAVLVVLAATLGSVVLLLPALLVYGAGTATSLQARYAGADLASPSRSGQAISLVLVATTLGAVIGPNMVSPMGSLAAAVGIPELAGPFMLAAVAYALAGVVLMVRLRPDPLLLARLRMADTADTGDDNRVVVETSIDDRDDRNATDGRNREEERTPLGDAESTLRPTTHHPPVDGRNNARRAVLLGGFIMVVAQMVMVAIMTMTPVHMVHHGHSLGAAGAVIAVHIAGMYLPSPITGALVDRFGARPIAYASGITLATSGVLAAASPSSSVTALAVALTILGIGWNLGLVSGTAILTESVPLSVRARTQGSVDLAIALAGAGGGLGSGVVASATSFPTLAVLGATAAVVVIPVVALEMRSQVTSVPL